MESFLHKDTRDNFKVGDWFYLNRYARARKLSNQQVINIKLGVSNVLDDITNLHIEYIRQITRLEHNHLFYNINNEIEVK